ncbi:MAG: GMC family oxidoreductase [Hyphomicrobiaceae bacterium]
MSVETFDYIIAGAGSAGSVLAARLSENGRHSVLLLEAGPPDHNIWIHVPLGVTRLFSNQTYNWCFETAPVPELNGRAIYQPRGRVLGGTSSINGMVYIRGNPADYDGWRQNGCMGWDWDSVLPYFKKSQDQRRGGDDFHATGGPLRVSDITEEFALSKACIAAATEAGIPANPDFNGSKQEGTGFYQFTASRIRRWSAARAFLKPARKRHNLRIETDALATRIEIENGRATGLSYRTPKGEHLAMARGEVIVSGGVFGSPHLLQLSGIGPGDVLKAAGVGVIRAHPQVGRNLHDHFNLHLAYRCRQPITANDLANSSLRRYWAGLKYVLAGRGPLATSGVCAGVFTRTDERFATPDLQINFLLYSSARRASSGLVPHPFSAFSMSLVHLRSESRGEVTIASANADRAPTITMRFMETEYEKRAMIAAIGIGRHIARQPSLQPLIEEEILPGHHIQSEEEMMADIRERAIANYHPVGTCRMGSDPDAVVDPSLKVNGIAALRVVDASIMPQITTGNTNAPTIMIAEKASDMILSDAR